ncbi:flagellar protein FlaG [uncultured Halovibrio sp.]|uniref:flagellar protein FlaG n=1 Tax=uncultured Halovibrio sp. TaxID=985049 RepID=UPI0025FD19EF|nr:flagellar protein FlaG [uncultured Halovibrio sp.]
MSDINLNSPDPNRKAPEKPESGRVSAPSSQPSASGEGRENGSVTPIEAGRSGETRAEKSEKRSDAIREELNEAVSRLNDFVQSVQRDLEFDVNDDTGQTVVRVIDQQTDEVVRQIPDDLALKLAENLQQDEPLSLLNIKV